MLIEYAEWMNRHKYPAQDVEDQLLLAVDTLMDTEPGWDDEDDAVEDLGKEDFDKAKQEEQLT